VQPDQALRDNQGASPRHKLHLRSNMDLPKRLGLDLNLQYVSALKTPTVPSRVRLDALLSWRPTVDTELSGGVRNVLDDRTPEFVAEDFGVAAETPRSALLKLTWRF
jgi:outer membrane receptor protein involved in Fe transport